MQDNEESSEYEKLLNLLKQLKAFLKNKLHNLINVDEAFGVPNARNQNIVRESSILTELIELMVNIWPDESYMLKLFDNEDYCNDDSQSIASSQLT